MAARSLQTAPAPSVRSMTGDASRHVDILAGAKLVPGTARLCAQRCAPTHRSQNHRGEERCRSMEEEHLQSCMDKSWRKTDRVTMAKTKRSMNTGSCAPSIPFQSIHRLIQSVVPWLTFLFHRRHPVRADFSGGQITSDAWVLPPRAFDQRHQASSRPRRRHWRRRIRSARPLHARSRVLGTGPQG